MLHWQILKEIGAPGLESNWWRHKPEAVIKHDGHEVVWDQFVAPNIASGIKDRRPDIIWAEGNTFLNASVKTHQLYALVQLIYRSGFEISL